MAKGKQTSLLQAKTSRQAVARWSAQEVPTEADIERVITVTAKPSAKGGFDLSYSPELCRKRSRTGWIRLVLDDADNVGCHFSGFCWLWPILPGTYCTKIEVLPAQITLKLDNRFQSLTDVGYKVCVAASGRRASRLAMRASVSSRSVNTAWLIREMDMLESEATVVVDHVMAIQQQLLARGPIIRNDPR